MILDVVVEDVEGVVVEDVGDVVELLEMSSCQMSLLGSNGGVNQLLHPSKC